MTYEEQLKARVVELEKKLEEQIKATRTATTQLEAYKIDIERRSFDNKNAVELQNCKTKLDEVIKKAGRIYSINEEIKVLTKERERLLSEICK